MKSKRVSFQIESLECRQVPTSLMAGAPLAAIDIRPVNPGVHVSLNPQPLPPGEKVSFKIDPSDRSHSSRSPYRRARRCP